MGQRNWLARFQYSVVNIIYSLKGCYCIKLHRPKWGVGIQTSTVHAWFIG